MIASDHSANFIPGRVSARRFLGATGGCDHELVAGEDEFRGDSPACLRVGIFQQPRPAFALRCEHLRRTQDIDDIPRLGRTNQGRGPFIREIHPEKSRAPELALVRVTAGLFGAINHLLDPGGGDSECRRASAKPHAQRSKFPARRRDLVAFLDRAQFVRLRQRDIDRVLVMPEMKRRPQLEPRRLSRPANLVTDVHRVLQMRHRDALLDDKIADVVNPDRHPVFEAKFAQILGALQIELPARAFLRA